MINRLFYIIVLFLVLASCNKRISGSLIHEEEKECTEIKRLEYEYVLSEAIRFKLLGDLNEAEKLFMRCVELSPESHVPYYELANILYYRDDFDKAVEFSNRAIENDKTNKWYYKQLAQFFFQNDNITDAIRIYEMMIDYIEPDVEALYILAQFYFQNSQYEKGLEIYERVENIIGIDHEIIHDKKEIYLHIGEYELAYNEVSRLINAYPDDHKTHLMLADLYTRIGMHNEAEKKYKEILVLDKNNITALINLIFYSLENNKYEKGIEYLEKAIIHPEIDTEQKNDIIFSSFEYIDIKKYYQELEDLVNKIRTTEEDDKQTLAVKAEFYIRAEKYEKALTFIYKLIEEESGNYYFREQLLFVLSYLGEHKSILQESNEALNFFPDDPIILYFNGFANYVLENIQEAKSSFIKCVNNLSQNETELSAQVHAYIGEIYNIEKKYEKSDEYFEKSIKLDSNNPNTLNNYAYFLSIREEKLELAEELSSKSIEIDPDNYAYLDTYAWIKYKNSDYKTALVYIEKAYRSNGSQNPEILEHYGDILIKLENCDQAVNKWKKAIELGGNESELMKKIKKSGLCGNE